MLGARKDVPAFMNWRESPPRARLQWRPRSHVSVEVLPTGTDAAPHGCV